MDVQGGAQRGAQAGAEGDGSETAPPGPPSARNPLSVRIFCCTILAAALGTGVALLLRGAPRPGAAPVLLLALVVALSINRFVLFPTEQAATAEAAVLLAAVVGFRTDAMFLGPLAVGLLVGPLDALHWQQRSYLRMAHNAGNRGLSALAAAAAFVGARDLLGSAPAALGAAIAAAVLAFASVDMLLSVSLMMVQGSGWHIALRHVVAIDVLTIPIAAYGAATGLLAGELGWWATALAVVPTAFVPEIVLARQRWRVQAVRDVLAAIGVGALLVAVAITVPVPDPPTLIALTGIAVLAGIELSADTRSAVPPLLAVVVMTAAIVVAGDGAFFAAAFVAATGTFTAWWGIRHGRAARRRAHATRAVVTAAAAGLVAAAVFEAAPRSVPAVMLGAVAAGFLFELAAITTGNRRRRRSMQTVWSAPLLVASAAWALTWQTIGLGGAALFASTSAAALLAAAWWGAPPWHSRYLGRWASRAPVRHHRAALGGVCVAAALLAVVATGAGGDARVALVWVAVGVGESAVAMVLVGVRQWRFAPRPRAIALGALLATTAALALAYPMLADHGSSAAPVAMAALLIVVLIAGNTPGARADHAVPGRARSAHDPTPVR